MRRLHGSIQKLDRDRWRVFATVHDETGASRRVSKTVSGSRNDAERVLDSMLGMEGARRDRPFHEVVEAYLDNARARVDDGRMARSTLEGYEGKLRRTVVPALGSTMASEVTAQRVQRFLDSLRTDRAATFRVLRVVLNWAYRAGYMPERVSDHVEPVRQRTGTVRREDVYARDEVAAILAHPMETPLKTAVVLALSCGLRRGEICALEWDDYDGRSITVRRAWGKDAPKTPGSAASLMVPRWARDYLDPLRGEGLMVGMPPGHVTDQWRRLWYDWAHRLRPDAPSVRYIPFKNLRHTSLSMVYEATGDIKAASRRGRHSSVYVTERFYVRASDAVDAKCADALDDALGDVGVSHG